MNGLELLLDYDSLHVSYQIFKFSGLPSTSFGSKHSGLTLRKRFLFQGKKMNQMFGFTNRDNKAIFPEDGGRGRGVDSYINM